MTATRPGADLILGRVRLWTAAGVPPGADAVAITGGRIAAVGRTRDLRRLAGRHTRELDLAGSMVLPAFQDAHVHALEGGMESLGCDLSHVAEVADAYRAAIVRFAEAHPERAWIIGSGWSMAAFARGEPTRDLLDDIVVDRPVYLVSGDGHSAWVNGRALALAGIGPGTPDPPLGRIVRDADGAPTGTLHELATWAIDVVRPTPTLDEHLDGLRIGQAYLHSLGISAWQEANVDEPMLDAYLVAVGRDVLTGRVSAALRWDETDGLGQIDALGSMRRRVPPGGLLRVGTVKMFQDGVMENRTAAMLAPYLDGHGAPTPELGQSRFPAPDFAATVTLLERRGFQVHVHAIGDRAVREALDAFEAAHTARTAGIGADLRHHIAHLQSVDPADLGRFAILDVTANAQPLWASEDGAISEFTRPFLGDERTDRMYPFGSLARAGARLAMGSDWSVTSADPLAIIEVASRRTDPERRGVAPFAPAEAITVEQALVAYTRGSAYVNHLDAETGELMVGRLADLVVLDRDILAPEAGPPADARVLLTLVEGEIVYEAALTDCSMMPIA